MDKIDSFASEYVLLIILRSVAEGLDLTVVVGRIVELIVLVFLSAEPFVPAWGNVPGAQIPRIAIEILPNQGGPVTGIMQPGRERRVFQSLIMRLLETAAGSTVRENLCIVGVLAA